MDKNPLTRIPDPPKFAPTSDVLKALRSEVASLDGQVRDLKQKAASRPSIDVDALKAVRREKRRSNMERERAIAAVRREIPGLGDRVDIGIDHRTGEVTKAGDKKVLLTLTDAENQEILDIVEDGAYEAWENKLLGVQTFLQMLGQAAHVFADLAAGKPVDVDMAELSMAYARVAGIDPPPSLLELARRREAEDGPRLADAPEDEPESLTEE